MAMKRYGAMKAVLAVLLATTPLAVAGAQEAVDTPVANGAETAENARTLREALAIAYRTNPDLTVQRAIVRQLDETVAQAAAEGRPTLNTSVGIDQSFSSINLGNDGRVLDARATVNVPVYTGGRISNSIRAADRRVEAGRLDLETVENQVFLNTTSAYMDVLRDQAVVDLNQNQVRVLEEQLRASRDRFEVGDLTRTDVAQSEARLATARANLAAAVGQLQFSREAFRRQVGLPPADLAAPAALPRLPASAAEAIDQALETNPALQAARLAEAAARYDVAVARAGRLPTVSGNAGIRHTDALGTSNLGGSLPPGITVNDSNTTPTAGVSLSMPLFQSGAVSSRIRQARARQSQAQEQVALIERQVVANARNAYEALETAAATIDSAQTAVTANELALEGARQENLVGSRTVLDVLNAEQELLNTRVALVRARRDQYVAGMQLLAAIGRAEIENLGVPVERYDPRVNYRRVRNDWWDWSDGPAPQRAATSPDLSDVTGRTN